MVPTIKGLLVLFFIYFFNFSFHTGFQPIKDGRLIRFMRRGMHTGQTLFPMKIELSLLTISLYFKILSLLVYISFS